jgi:hypothetical protein
MRRYGFEAVTNSLERPFFGPPKSGKAHQRH